MLASKARGNLHQMCSLPLYPIRRKPRTKLIFLIPKMTQLCALGGAGGHYTPTSFCNCTLWELAERETVLAEVGQREL